MPPPTSSVRSLPEELGEGAWDHSSLPVTAFFVPVRPQPFCSFSTGQVCRSAEGVVSVEKVRGSSPPRVGQGWSWGGGCGLFCLF